MQAVREMFYGLRRPRQLNEGKLHDQRVRGERAEALLRDEVLIEALKSIEETYMTAWRKSEGLDVDRRERAHSTIESSPLAKRNAWRTASACGSR